MAGVALARSAARRRVPAGVWGFALLAATVADWFDGPLARRQPGGPSAWGAWLDIEADSWLTLWCAIAAVAGRRLPAWALVPPVARYGRRVFALRPHRPWQQAAGAFQMTVLLGALSPSRRLQRSASALLPAAMAAQLAALAAR